VGFLGRRYRHPALAGDARVTVRYDPDQPAWILVFRDGEPLGPAVDVSTMKGARQFPSDTQFDDGAGITDRQVRSG
jgi:hypothetical protein